MEAIMSDDQGTYQQLAGRFEKHHTRKQGGQDLLYVGGEQVIERLNTILGFDGWSFEVKDVKILEDEVWALGRMTVYSGDRTIVREQAGGQIINRKRGIPATPYRPAQPADDDRPAVPAVEAQPAVKGEPIEIANDIKGAVTDCLKKCATLIGVATYLYDQDERREVEAEMRAEQRGGARPDPTTRSNASAAPAARATASTPAASGAAPSSSSTTATPAPTPINSVRNQAALGGAVTTLRCTECATDVPKDATLTILRKKEGPSVAVSVKDFEPVCIERLGTFHCARCYDKKYWGVA